MQAGASLLMHDYSRAAGLCHKDRGLLQEVWRQDGGAGAVCAHSAHFCALCCRRRQHALCRVRLASSMQLMFRLALHLNGLCMWISVCTHFLAGAGSIPYAECATAPSKTLIPRAPVPKLQ